ncbi:MAG: 16S rRNA (guanine(527)-N(7))-methyltransferase RsmG [Sphingomonadaceae bacterium]
MTEDEARHWLIANHDVSRETLAKLDSYAVAVAAEQRSQNLVSAATLSNFWSRHIVDSAQLLRLGGAGSWLDIGSGAGLPGLVIAVLTHGDVLLVEPRPLRANFLVRLVQALDLPRCRVAATPIARVDTETFAVITARAVAPLPKLVAMAGRFADLSTIWVLPKGRSAQSELASLPTAWQGHWSAVPSVTDPSSRILIGRGIRGDHQLS